MIFAMMSKHPVVIFSEVIDICTLISSPEIPPLKVRELNYYFKLVTVITPKREYQEKPLLD